MRILALCFFLQAFSGCYVTKQAWHQGKLYRSRQSIAELLSSPSTEAKLRQQLEFSQEVIAYGKTQGLSTENAYRYYVELGRESISSLVEAAYPDRLESITWWFPVVGRVPYLGYFDEKERDAYAEKLRAEGYDIYTTTATAFSSLGWFDDPLYSSMVRRSKESLAAILFHELTHRTVWISGHAEFNEQLASFVEIYLTRKYLQELNLKENLQHYEDLLHDQGLYRQWVEHLSAELREFYQKAGALPAKGEQSLFSTQKNAIFERFVTQLVPRFKHYNLIGTGAWNNARVLASASYQPDYQRFYASLQCSKAETIGTYLQQVQEAWKKHPVEPYEIIDQFCIPLFIPQEGGHNDRNQQSRAR
jgi:predicted aminopeptidase